MTVCIPNWLLILIIFGGGGFITWACSQWGQLKEYSQLHRRLREKGYAIDWNNEEIRRPG